MEAKRRTEGRAMAIDPALAALRSRKRMMMTEET
jgi:hypothetical protein